MITISQAAQFMGLTNPTEAQEELIGSLIESVTAEIEAYCDRILLQRVVTETVELTFYDFDLDPSPGFSVRNGQPYVQLNEFPVSDLILKEDNVTVNVDNYTLYPLLGITTLEKRLNTRRGALVADYLAGYEVLDPDESGDIEITYLMPKDLQLVAKQGVKAYFADSGAVSQGSSNIKSKSLDRFSVTYGNSNDLIGGKGGKTYIETNKHILNRYKRHDVWG